MELVLIHGHGMPDARVTKALELKAQGATRVTFDASGEVASVEFDANPPLPRSNEDSQDEHSDPRKTYPRRPTGGLVTRAAADDS